MKVLFEYPTPFAFAPGGRQEQILRLQEILPTLGIEVEFMRWYDDRQTGNILHYFGRIPPELLYLARTKGMKIVMAESFAGKALQSSASLWLHRRINRFLENVLKQRGGGILSLRSYQLADAFIAETPAEAHLMTYLFEALPAKVHVVENNDWLKAAEQLKQIYEVLL